MATRLSRKRKPCLADLATIESNVANVEGHADGSYDCEFDSVEQSELVWTLAEFPHQMYCDGTRAKFSNLLSMLPHYDEGYRQFLYVCSKSSWQRLHGMGWNSPGSETLPEESI